MVEQFLGLFLEKLFSPLLVALILAAFARHQQKRDKEQDEKDKLGEENELIKDELLEATADLSYATAMAVESGKPNGEIKVAIGNYNAAKEHKAEFVRKLSSKLAN